MPRTHSVYLNNHFYSGLRAQLEKAQNKAQVAQWINFIHALKQKGVKQIEIEDSNIIKSLEGLDKKHVLQRAELLQLFDRNDVKIRELVLPHPSYPEYRLSGGTEYKETMYILESEKDYLKYQLAQIRFELQELNFDLDALATNPERVYELDNQRKIITEKMLVAHDFYAHHYSTIMDPDEPGQHIRNLMAHARTTKRNDIFFIDEIQSDWAQKFRRTNGASKNYPRAPFITNTEVWSAIVLKRQLQRAAADPTIKRLAWITGDLRNGRNGVCNDGLNEFYIKILPKIMSKFLKNTGESVKMANLKLNANPQEYAVPTIEITDAVRKKALEPAPLYSLDADEDYPSQIYTAKSVDEASLLQQTPPAFRDAFLGAKEMFSGVFELRLVSHILDDATQLPASGSFLGNVLSFSFNGRDRLGALSHELWHLAESALLDPLDVATIHDAFAPGKKLNTAVRHAMVADGANPRAVAQCDSAEEAAAFGFALWRKGKLQIKPQEEDIGQSAIDKTVGKIFVRVEKAFHSLARWVKRLIVDETRNEFEQKVVDQAFTNFAKSLDQATIKAATKRLWDEQQNIRDEVDYASIERRTTRPAMRA